MSSEAAGGLSRPRSPAHLFFALTVLALQGFGGVMAVAQRELVERRRWLTNEEFVEEWAVAQIIPGPNICNLAIMLGGRWFGWRGALAGICGMVTLPLVLILLLALLYANFADHPGVAGALRGMGAVAAGLIIATALKLMAALRTNPLGPLLCLLLGVACFVAVAVLRLPLVYVLLGLGFTGWLLAYYRIKAREA